MTADVLAEILTWSQDRPAWQRDALRRLFTTGAIGDEDVDEFVEICKGTHGLCEPQTTEGLAKKHLAINDRIVLPHITRGYSDLSSSCNDRDLCPTLEGLPQEHRDTWARCLPLSRSA